MAYLRTAIGGFGGGAYSDPRGAAGLTLSVPVGGLARLAKWMFGKSSGPGAAATPARIGVPASTSSNRQDLLDRVAKTGWYHTIELGDGVVTPGSFDHRPYLDLYKLPENLAGQRVLDVATFDGFWAFEMERRGADEVVALDIDCWGDIDIAPRKRQTMSADELATKTGVGFAIAREALGSHVRRVVCNVYDLSPEKFGLFDVVHIGDVLLHLSDPLLALQNVRAVTKDYALISDVFWPELASFEPRRAAAYFGGGGENAWWRPGYETLRQMILDAGFDKVEPVATLRYAEQRYLSVMWHVVFKAS